MMPQATNELRQKMHDRFGDSIDDHGPWMYLEERGYTEDGFLIHAPVGHVISEEEGDCIDFLCDEWDWAFAGAGN